MVVSTWDELRWLLLQKAVDQESVSLELINERGEIAVRRLDLRAAGEQGWRAMRSSALASVFIGRICRH
jgi:regulator of sigma E protease